MKILLMFSAVLFMSQLSFSEGLYTDTWVNWTPRGKVFDIVCFSKKEGNRIYKNVRVTQLNKSIFQYRAADTSETEVSVASTKNCYFEQKDSHPVSRDEFFEEIVSVKCTLNQLPFKDGDFRILGTNPTTTSVKRLRDGKVWVLPTADCNFTTQLQKKEMVPASSIQQPIALSAEGSSVEQLNIPPVYSNGTPVAGPNTNAPIKKTNKIDAPIPDVYKEPSVNKSVSTKSGNQSSQPIEKTVGSGVNVVNPESEMADPSSKPASDSSSIKSLIKTLDN